MTKRMQLKITNKREGGEKNMKKALMIVLAILISVAFVTTVLAQDKKAPAPTDKPAAATEKPAKEKAVEKAKKAGMKKFEGEFVSKDDAAKTIVVKGETEMTFDVAKAKMGKVAAGDKVVVAYTEKDGKNIAKSVTKAGAAKEKKAEKKAEKK
ncbi:MAG: hypothetical protein H6Q52_2967, partial [Deltaproteobacteria bacterium]|nr:hypothetical protein [Deltaproteobacteria bacterium]